FVGSRDIDPGRPEHYVSGNPLYGGYHFRQYACSIDAFPENHFDLVLIDGRARPSCARHSARHVRVGGWVVLDDAVRPHYAAIQEQFDGGGWERRDFEGPGL